MKEWSNYERGVACMLLYAFAMALLSLFSKIVLTDDGIFVFLFSRYFLTLLVLFPFLFWLGILKELKWNHHLLPMVTRGFIVMLSLNLFFYCLIHTSLFNATVLYNTGPIFIPLLAKWMYKAPIDKRVWWSISLAFAGVLCVLKPDSGILNVHSIAGGVAGFLMALSSILYAKVSTGQEKLSLNVFSFLLIATAFSFLLLLAYNGWYQGNLPHVTEEFFHMDWRGWTAMAATVVFLIVNQMARGLAFRFAPVQKLAPYMYSIIVFSGIFDWLIFNHPPGVLSLVGGGLVVAGVILELYFQKSIKT